ncbi:cyclin-dependent kinase inhibitor 3 family protein [Vibrio olivae]|uniref:Cyclin-dependent kinase inhibitor 3 family protein n=1 Tax=Vibrio olivae TaxID=1243002 RepID=A0ABV5HK43_9VIBR
MHPTWELPLEQESALILTPCPGTKDVGLAQSIAQLKQQGVRVVVTALSQQEMDEKGVSSLADEVESAGLQWLHAPIEDDCAPDEAFTKRWRHIAPVIHGVLSQGGKVALHCMGGSGRTGLLAAHVLLEKGWALDEIINQVQALRPGAFTKTIQLEYIRQQASKS